MFANRPPLSLFQVQTLGGTYSDGLFMRKASCCWLNDSFVFCCRVRPGIYLSICSDICMVKNSCRATVQSRQRVLADKTYYTTTRLRLRKGGLGSAPW